MRQRVYVALILCATVLLLAGCKPKVSFEVSNTEGAPPLKVDFTGTCQTVLLGFVDFSAIIPVTGQIWDFGDGGDISEGINATHTYNNTGKYTVSLAATNLFGTTTVTRADLINITGTAPTASFTASPSTGNAPLPVIFSDSSQAGSKPITAWVWNFGDGASSTVQNPTHSFTATGLAGQTQQFTVHLTVSNALGSSSFSSQVGVTTVGPAANFTADPIQGDAPLTVTFTDASTAGSLPITAWEWNFGDGGAATTQNPAHIYGMDGTYSVSLTVTTAAGASEKVRAGYITVNLGAPVARFRATDTTGLAPFDTSFKDLSIPGRTEIATYSWDFGDGGHSTAQHPLHTYQTPGDYTVALTVTTDTGSDTETKEALIHVYGAPQAAMSVAAGTASGQYTFSDTTDLGGAPLVSRLWDFGDGNTHNIANPIHTYAAPGTYTAILTITANDGQEEPFVSTATQEISFSAAR